MAVRLVCRACGERLKVPDGGGREQSPKCPKCLARVDRTAAMGASASLPTVAVPGMAPVPAAPAPPRGEPERKSPPLLGEDDPLPYPAPKPAASTPSPSKSSPPPLP